MRSGCACLCLSQKAVGSICQNSDRKLCLRLCRGICSFGHTEAIRRGDGLSAHLWASLYKYGSWEEQMRWCRIQISVPDRRGFSVLVLGNWNGHSDVWSQVESVMRQAAVQRHQQVFSAATFFHHEESVRGCLCSSIFFFFTNALCKL